MTTASLVSPPPALPCSAALLLPHAAPMLCVGTLVAWSETSATTHTIIEPDHIFLVDGTLERAALVEMAAQTAGAMQGYTALQATTPVGQGLLVGVQDCAFFADARVGDELTVTVAATAEFSGVTVLQARVQRGEELLAEGNLKVFLEPLPAVGQGES